MGASIDTEKVVIKLSNSEAKLCCQITKGSDSEQCNYFIPNNEEVRCFFELDKDNKLNMDCIIDIEGLKEYYTQIKSQLLFFACCFKGKLEQVEQSYKTIKSNKGIIPRMYFTGINNKYLSFDNKDKTVDAFRNLLFGEISWLQFEKKSGKYYITPLLEESYVDKLLIKNDEVNQDELCDLLSKYNASNQDVGISLFGYDFAYVINKYKVELSELLTAASIPSNCVLDIQKGMSMRFSLDKRKVVREKDKTVNEEHILVLNDSRVSYGTNMIYYGIPGCGKSYTVDQYIKQECSDEIAFKNNVIRTTFYLDYSNADFIGQLIPKTDSEGHVSYVPNYGPFSKALKRSYETTEMVYLVIEEINRGNAAAIFGDLFQLLDRLNEKKSINISGSKPGDSEYPITNSFIEDYLGVETGKVIIPSNLTIIGTMNTSDQNVFPLDTAFKRRWKMKKIEDDHNNSMYHDYYIPQMNSEIPLQWHEFLEKINRFILSNDEGINLEDKQIGSYFITDDVLLQDPALVDNKERDDRAEQFNHKVLEYIWSDVAKFDRPRWVDINQKVKEKPKSFNDLVKLVNEYGIVEILSAFHDPKDS